MKIRTIILSALLIIGTAASCNKLHQDDFAVDFGEPVNLGESLANGIFKNGELVCNIGSAWRFSSLPSAYDYTKSVHLYCSTTEDSEDFVAGITWDSSKGQSFCNWVYYKQYIPNNVGWSPMDIGGMADWNFGSTKTIRNVKSFSVKQFRITNDYENVSLYIEISPSDTEDEYKTKTD